MPGDITHSKWHYEMDYEPLSVWKRVCQPTLFLFAEIDEWVPIEESMVNYRSATAHLKDVIYKQIEGIDHLMCNQAGEISLDYLNILINWLRSRFKVSNS